MNTDRDFINSKYVSRYSLEEQGACVKEYLAGASKKELADKLGVSERTIERWIKKYRRKDNDLEFQMRKRNEKISEESQRKLMKILNDNAILYGFYISTWNEERVMTLVKNEFGIDITTYIAKQLLDDSKVFGIENEQNAENIIKNEINCLKEKGYKAFSVDFVKIGIIDKCELEPFVFNKYKQNKVYVNLALARGENSLYMKIIFTEQYFFKKTKTSVRVIRRERKKSPFESRKKSENEKQMIDKKAKFIREIVNQEKDKILIITTEDSVTKRFNKRSKNIGIYIVNDDINEKVFKSEYEENYKLLVKHITKGYMKYENVDNIESYVKKSIYSYFNDVNSRICIKFRGILYKYEINY